MNTENNKKGYYRDCRVLDHADKLKCVNAEQIHLLEFTTLSRVMSYRCLNRLVAKKRLKTPNRLNGFEPSIYWPYDEQKPKNHTHQLGKGDIYTFLRLRARVNEVKFKLFINEPKMYADIVEPDELVVLEFPKELKYFFGEFHRVESGNGFDKFPKYNKLHERLEKPDRYFTLIVVTTGGQDDKRKLEELMAKQKSGQYKVEILTQDELRSYSWKFSSTLREHEKKGDLTNG